MDMEKSTYELTNPTTKQLEHLREAGFSLENLGKLGADRFWNVSAPANGKDDWRLEECLSGFEETDSLQWKLV